MPGRNWPMWLAVQGHPCVRASQRWAGRMYKVKVQVHVITCGHSLGGAVASLAAHDIVTQCKLPSQNVSCYTFGAPRVGNHAFAAEYERLVCFCMLPMPSSSGCLGNQTNHTIPG